MATPTILIVPGLRDRVAQHWQTLLEARLREAGRSMASVPRMGRDDLDCATKVAAIERVAQSVSGPIVIVAHSGGTKCSATSEGVSVGGTIIWFKAVARAYSAT